MIKNLNNDSIIFNRHKVVICVIVIMMAICLDVEYVYSQEKPSEDRIKYLIILLEQDSKLLPIYRKNLRYNSFSIVREYYSSKNGRYCIEANLDISFEGRKSTIDDFKLINVRIVNKRYSFEKKHSQWIGYKGWGPKED